MEVIGLISLIISGALLVLSAVLTLLNKSPGLRPDAFTIRYLIVLGITATIYEFSYFMQYLYVFKQGYQFIESILLLVFSYYYLRFVLIHTERSRTRSERFAKLMLVILFIILSVDFLFIHSYKVAHYAYGKNSIFFHPDSYWISYLVGAMFLLNLLHSLIYIIKSRKNDRVKIKILITATTIILAGFFLWDNLVFLHDKRRFIFPVSFVFLILMIINYIWYYVKDLQIELNNRASELVSKRHELELQKIRTDEANRIKDEFIANISHELRTPLTTIIGFAELLKKYFASTLPETQLSHLERISRNGRQLQQLINDILNYAMLEKGEYEIEITKIDVKSVKEFIRATVHPLISDKSVELITEIKNLDFIYNDENSIKQILLQLMHNAAKFTKKGYMKIKLEGQKDLLILVVEDTGIGIKPEDQRLIFERFRQVDRSFVKSYRGTGLGLAIIQKIVSLLHGTIRVESEPLIGTKFIIYLPNISTDVPGKNKETLMYTKK